MMFSDEDELKTHVRDVHGSELSYECINCGELFDSDFEHKSHEFKCGTAQKYSCLQCDEKFDSSHELRDHENESHPRIAPPMDDDQFEPGAFVVFIKNGEEVLLLRRSESDLDYPNTWDGVYGVNSNVLSRVREVTGLEEDIKIVRIGAERTAYPGGRRLEVTPYLVSARSFDIELKGSYVESSWIDPGDMRVLDCAFADYGDDGLIDLLHDMYGSVKSFVNIVKTGIGSEMRVAKDMHARLSGARTLLSVKDEVFSILNSNRLRGYLLVESSAQHHVEKLIGRTGGKDRKSRSAILSTPLKNAKTVLDGDAPLRDILPYLEPKAVTSGIEVGCIVEIITGAFKGEKARVVSVAESKEEVSMELYEADIPMTLNMRGDHVRVIERVE
jgi:transcriptional antiterminator NusG